MNQEMVVSKTKLFVGGLNRKMRGNDLKTEFSKFGEVVFARVNLDPETKKSKGFGFVEFENEDDATRAKTEMDEQEIRGRVIKVDFAKEDPARLAQRQEYLAQKKNEEESEIEEGEELF